MTREPPLTPQDDDSFHGSVYVMPNGEWRASCTTHVGPEAKEQDPLSRSFETKAEARQWVQSIGLARGFKSIVWDD